MQLFPPQHGQTSYSGSSCVDGKDAAGTCPRSSSLQLAPGDGGGSAL